MWIFNLCYQIFNLMKSHTDGSYCGFEDVRDINPGTNANPVSDIGRFSAIEIAVESIPDTTEPGNGQEVVKFPHETRPQLGNSSSLCHD